MRGMDMTETTWQLVSPRVRRNAERVLRWDENVIALLRISGRWHTARRVGDVVRVREVRHA